MFSFDPIAFLFLLALIAAFLLSLLGLALKLAGVLLIAWWWILIPVPAVIVVGLLMLGIGSLLK